jgi:hypothetical protein
MPGIGQGEDRHFCMRAEALHLRMVADPWPDIFHIYHRPDDEALIPEMLTRLSMYTPPPDPLTGEAIPGNPGIGDLVSLELHAMEPIPTQHGLTPAPTQYVRGRLGQVGLHPELSEAVTGMQRGEVKIVPVHFGLDYPFPPYRGLRRLIRVTLIDHKPFGLPPVVEDEVLTNRIGATMDTTTLTPGLIDQMREVHAV